MTTNNLRIPHYLPVILGKSASILAIGITSQLGEFVLGWTCQVLPWRFAGLTAACMDISCTLALGRKEKECPSAVAAVEGHGHKSTTDEGGRI